jgi:hypothetical protein
MSQYAFFAYWNNIDANMLETCIASLRRVSQCVIYIATEGVPQEVEDRLDIYRVFWIRVPKEKAHKRRACCKIEILENLAKQLDNNDLILVSDVDMVFLKDPFTPFWKHKEMDLGLTTRGYPHAFPINGGIFYMRIHSKMKMWLHWHLQEIYHPTWEPYVKHRRRWNHEHYGLDWSVGQDFLVANWVNRQKIKQDRDIDIVDVGPDYNYCPPTDTMGQKAFNMAWDALKEGKITALHLKSDLKRMIYDSKFPNACINHSKGKTGWL